MEIQQVRTLFRSAEKAVAQGKIEEAERLFIQALTIDPTACDVRAELAKLYLTSTREPKAEALTKNSSRRRMTSPSMPTSASRTTARRNLSMPAVRTKRL